MRGTFAIFLCWLATGAFAQINDLSTAMWYFGDSAALDFSSCEPTVITDNAMPLQIENCISMSDENGNLLFYSNGHEVWNANHQVMPNGQLVAFWNTSFSTSQGIIPIKLPGSNTRYYLVSVVGSQLVWYEINMNANGGLGDIVNYEFVTSNNFTEKVTAVAHANGEDIWVALHEFDSDSLYAYLLTSTGFADSAVISEVGSVHENKDYPGYFKFSTDGTKAALTKYGSGQLEIFQFNDSTGEFSNPVLIDPVLSELYTYGVEFSPDGNMLYVAFSDNHYENANTTDDLYQFDLTNYVEADILNSAYKLAEAPHPEVEFGALQLALNGKIYMTNLRFDTTASNIYQQAYWPESPYLSVINNPNEPKSLCGYQDSAVFLGNGRGGVYGLPNFVVSSLKPVDFEIGENTGCKDEPTSFRIDDSNASFDSVRWEFGVLDDGSTSFNPQYVYTQNGKYYVTLLVHDNCRSYETHELITIEDRPDFSLPDDTALCPGDSIMLMPVFSEYISNDTTYLWSNGKETAEINVDESGQYVLSIGDGKCVGREIVTISPGDCDEGFSIPNIVTANNDLHNDCFTVALDDDARFEVYNRWGKLVHQDDFFDGSWCDITLSDGVYHYLLRTEADEYKGWLQVSK